MKKYTSIFSTRWLTILVAKNIWRNMDTFRNLLWNVFKEGNLCITKNQEGFPGGSVISNLPANAGDAGGLGLSLGSGGSLGGGSGNPLQFACVGNPMDRGARWATVRGVSKSQTWLSIEHNFTGDRWDKDGLRHETFYLFLKHLRLSHQKGRNSKCHEANSSWWKWWLILKRWNDLMDII